MSFRNKVLVTLLLAGLSFAGNYFSVTLFYGISFIFGSVAVMLAVTLLGTWSAVIIALVGGSYTLILWGHPYALAIFAIEALVVSLLYRRGMRNLVLTDFIYWLVLGVPLVILFYTQGVNIGFEPSLLVALKQFLNGVFNTLLVTFGLIIWRLTIKGKIATESNVSGGALLFNSFLLVTLTAGVSPIIYEGHNQVTTQETLLATRLKQHAGDIVELLNDIDKQSVERQQHLLQGFQSRHGISLGILASNGAIVMQSGAIKSLSGTGSTAPVNNDLTVWLPEGEMSAMQRWQQGVYLYSQAFDVASQSMRLLIELPAEKMVNQLKKEHLRLFIMLTVIFISAVALIYILSNIIMRPLKTLEAVSKHMATDIAQGENLKIPNIRIREYNNLAQSLTAMSSKLSESFQSLESAHSMLEEKVEKRTQELNMSNRAMQNVMDASTQFAIISTDLDGVITLFNSGAELMLGYSAEEIIGNQTPALFHLTEEVAKREVELGTLLEKVISGFQVFTEIPMSKGFETREWTYVTKHGEYLSVSLTITVRQDSNGNIVGFLGIAEDISERKNTISMLEHVKYTLDHTLDCIFMFDSNSMNFYYANEGALKQVGYSQEELLTMHPWEIKPEITKQQFAELVKPFLAGEQSSIVFETVHQHKLGKRIPVEILLQYQQSKDLSGHFVAIVRDVSERKQIQAELIAQAQHTQAILDKMVDGIITIDMNGSILSYNPAAKKIFGYSDVELQGENIKMLMGSPHREMHDNYIQNYQTSGVARIIGIGREVEGRRKDGNFFPMELSISEIVQEDSVVYVGMVRDITERKRIEQMKNEFVSTVSHELRTPLTSISGALGLLVNGTLGELSHQAQKMTDIAYKNSQRLSHLINDLLDMEKIVAGKMQFNMRRLRLGPEISQALESHKTYSSDKQVKLVMNNLVPDAQVLADSHRLQQVLANILSNAIKFSPENSTVNVEVNTIQEFVRISISDKGLGIPEEFRANVFEKFAQADSTDSRVKGGTGLGLAITRELVENMGGIIGFDSVEGEGAIFWFELPLIDYSRFTLDKGERLALSKNLGHILVVEDDSDVAEVIRSLLDDRGYTTDIAYTGYDALNALANNHYDAISLDLMLPDMNGRDIIKQLRNDNNMQNIPIMVISASVEEGQQDLASDICAIECLSKPFDQHRLIKTIDTLIEISTNTKVKVLHIEDDIDLHHVIERMLGERFNLELATSLEEARQVIIREQFDIIILDIYLPDGTGMELISELRYSQPQSSVIILSAIEVSLDEVSKVEAVLLKSQITASTLLETLSCSAKMNVKN